MKLPRYRTGDDTLDAEVAALVARVSDPHDADLIFELVASALRLARDEVHVVDAAPVGGVVDTTGAGDLFAAGFLYGLTHGYDLGTAARVGAVAAGEVISHLGARPATTLAALAAPLLDR